MSSRCMGHKLWSTFIDVPKPSSQDRILQGTVEQILDGLTVLVSQAVEHVSKCPGSLVTSEFCILTWSRFTMSPCSLVHKLSSHILKERMPGPNCGELLTQFRCFSCVTDVGVKVVV